MLKPSTRGDSEGIYKTITNLPSFIYEITLILVKVRAFLNQGFIYIIKYPIIYIFSYCDNCTTSLLSELTEQLLRELDRFQKRAVAQNAIKAHAHRRFVVGLREANNFLLVNKVKLIIIAPDCETCDGEGRNYANIAYNLFK